MEPFIAMDTHRPSAYNLLVFLLLTVAVQAQGGVPRCYYPNSALARGDYACDLSTDHSACCAIGSVCLDNRICGFPNGQRIRGSCTDPSWASPDCPQYCLDADTGGTDLISCENVTSNARDFCCDHNDFCCDDGAGRFRLDTAGEPKRTLGSAASTATKMPKTSTSTSATSISEATAAVPSGSPSAPPLIPDPELPSSPGLSTGAKAGIGIGAALGAIIVLAAIFFLWKWRPSRRAPTDVPHDDGPLVPHTDDRPQTGMIAGPPTAENDSYYGSGLYEMPGQQHRELSGRPQYEMPARHHSAAREMPG